MDPIVLLCAPGTEIINTFTLTNDGMWEAIDKLKTAQQELGW